MPTAHSTDLYILGKGILKFDRWVNGVPTGLKDMGNCTSFSLAPTEETKKHYSSREGVQKVDLEVTTSRELGVKFTLEEYDKNILAMALFGDTSGFSINLMQATEVVGTLDFVGTNELGPRYHVQLWKVKLRSTGEVNFISDDWGNIQFEGVVLDDQANHPSQPYGIITPLGES